MAGSGCNRVCTAVNAPGGSQSKVPPSEINGTETQSSMFMSRAGSPEESKGCDRAISHGPLDSFLSLSCASPFTRRDVGPAVLQKLTM